MIVPLLITSFSSLLNLFRRQKYKKTFKTHYFTKNNFPERNILPSFPTQNAQKEGWQHKLSVLFVLHQPSSIGHQPYKKRHRVVPRYQNTTKGCRPLQPFVLASPYRERLGEGGCFFYFFSSRRRKGDIGVWGYPPVSAPSKSSGSGHIWTNQKEGWQH